MQSIYLNRVIQPIDFSSFCSVCVIRITAALLVLYPRNMGTSTVPEREAMFMMQPWRRSRIPGRTREDVMRGYTGIFLSSAHSVSIRKDQERDLD
jgi:hypothetical protein